MGDIDFSIDNEHFRKLFRLDSLGQPVFDYFIVFRIEKDEIINEEDISIIFEINGFKKEITNIYSGAYENPAFPEDLCFVYSDCLGYNSVDEKPLSGLYITGKWIDKQNNDEIYLTEEVEVELPQLPVVPKIEVITDKIDFADKNISWDIVIGNELLSIIDGDISSSIIYNSSTIHSLSSQQPDNVIHFSTNDIPESLLIQEGTVSVVIRAIYKFNLNGYYTISGDDANTVYNNHEFFILKNGPSFSIKFEINIENLEVKDNEVIVTLSPKDKYITHCLMRFDVKNGSKTIYSTLYADLNLNPQNNENLAVSIPFDTHDILVKNNEYNLIVQAKTTKIFDEYEVTQKQYSARTFNFKALAKITTEHCDIVYNKVTNSYFIMGEASLFYADYASLKILCTIKSKINNTLVQKHIKYVKDGRKIIINQDLGELGFPPVWNIDNPCSVTLSYEYL